MDAGGPIPVRPRESASQAGRGINHVFGPTSDLQSEQISSVDLPPVSLMAGRTRGRAGGRPLYSFFAPLSRRAILTLPVAAARLLSVQPIANLRLNPKAIHLFHKFTYHHPRADR
jgi:hypothetical protein